MKAVPLYLCTLSAFNKSTIIQTITIRSKLNMSPSGSISNKKTNCRFYVLLNLNCIIPFMNQLSNSTEWIDISRQSMIDTCTGEIHRNATVRKVLLEKAKNATAASTSGLPTGTTVNPQNEIKVLQELEDIEENIKIIKEISCLNNCSGHGECSNGKNIYI